jgi:hypothetical protein
VYHFRGTIVKRGCYGRGCGMAVALGISDDDEHAAAANKLIEAYVFEITAIGTADIVAGATRKPKSSLRRYQNVEAWDVGGLETIPSRQSREASSRAMVTA